MSTLTLVFLILALFNSDEGYKLTALFSAIMCVLFHYQDRKDRK